MLWCSTNYSKNSIPQNLHEHIEQEFNMRTDLKVFEFIKHTSGVVALSGIGQKLYSMIQ